VSRALNYSCRVTRPELRSAWTVARVSVAIMLMISVMPQTSSAQLQLASIDGVVTTSDDRPAAGAAVMLLDRRGDVIRSTLSAPDGKFHIAGVQPGSYSIRAEATPFRAEVADIQVGTGLPLSLNLRMSASAAEQVLVRPAAAEPGATSTRVTLGGESLRNASLRVRTRGLQEVIATVPGWGSEDNGLLHVRGVDEGVLYVVDGVPWYERFDSLFGVAPDPMTLESITVSSGYIPPEFGFKSGAVVEIRSAAAPAVRWMGAAEASVASESTGDGGVVAAGPVFTHGNLALNLAAQRSARFLDPTHPDNLHNTGHSVTGSVELGWQLTPASVLQVVAGAGGSGFDVPNDDLQQAAGQDQRQRANTSWQTVSWQRAWSDRTLSHIAGYHRAGRLSLHGTDADTPLAVAADRSIRRVGFLASVSHDLGGHLLKVGAEAAGIRLQEQFAFGVTDEEGGDFTPEVIAFSPASPFVFTDRRTPTLLSLYAQDSFRPVANLTIDLGVRADWSRMLTASSQISPRIGVAYRINRSGTTVRTSFGRFFQPPQSENLLLASSEQAYALSPFTTDIGAGGAPLLPEKQSALEVAVGQMLGRLLRLDVAYWRRWVRNVADPNVFLGTTIIFPNNVARGWASGIDVRVDLPRRRGWSAFASYANSRVEQAGPITGGLFLEDDVAEIADGERFTPDHDQRNVGAAGVSFGAAGTGVAVNARYESGTPLQVGDQNLDQLQDRAGAHLVDFARERVKPRKSLDVSVSQQLGRVGRADLTVRLAALNLTGSEWAYNFGNPFSGTHFGPGRTIQLGLRATFN
jgi:hypothetical protein